MSAHQHPCPKCTGRLIHLQRKGMLVEVCAQCSGMWFDAGELTMLIKVYKKFDAAGAMDSGFACVRCKGQLQEMSFPGTDVLVDRCADCQGIWLDHGELEILKRELSKHWPPEHKDLVARAREILSDIEKAGTLRFTCIKCEGKLWHLKREGIMVEMCSKCEGMWFDAGELTVLIEVYKKFDPQTGKPSGVDCLRCGAGLVELPYPGTEILIDRCPDCQGIWLDQGEFQQLRAEMKKWVPEDDKSLNERAQELFAGIEEAGADRMSCPKCAGQLMDEVIDRIPVERCESCDGTWFDAGELTIILGVSRRIRLKVGTLTGLRCIKCPDETLLELPYPGTDVQIDTCPDCRSIWLDKGELERLAEELGVTLADDAS